MLSLQNIKVVNKIINVLLLLLFIPSLIFTIIKFIQYKGQYSKWFSSLSTECKLQLTSINNINKTINDMKQASQARN